jgi:hypothetical protein
MKIYHLTTLHTPAQYFYHLLIHNRTNLSTRRKIICKKHYLHFTLSSNESTSTSRDRWYDFKNILPKKLAKILAFFAQTNASFCKKMIITLVFYKNANIFAENWQKSHKIVIITSTPGIA